MTAGKSIAELRVQSSPLLIQKQFIDDPAEPGSTVSVQYSIGNFNRFTAATLVSFTDDFDSLISGLAVTGSSDVSNCGASATVSGTGLMTFANGTIAAGQSCTFTVDLSVPAASAQGSLVSTSSVVSADVGGLTLGNSASDTLFIGSGFDFSKQFIDDPVGAGSSVVLRYSITNQSSVDDASGIKFEDRFPELFLDSSNVTLPAAGFCGLGSAAFLAIVGGDFSINFSGLALTSASTCTFDVVIAIPTSASAISYLSETTPISGVIGSASVVSGNASDTLVIVASPGLSKEFVSDPVLPGETVTVEYTLTNSDETQALTDMTFTDDYDAVISGLVASVLPASGFCGAGSTIAGTSTLTVSGASLTASSSCTFSVTLTVPAASALGAFASSTSNVSANSSGLSVSGSAASDTLIVSSIEFTITQIGGTTAPGEVAIFEYRLHNIGSSEATAIAFTHNLAAGGVFSVPAAR